MIHTIMIVIESPADPSELLERSITAAEWIAEEVAGTSFEDLVDVSESTKATETEVYYQKLQTANFDGGGLTHG